MNIRCTRNTGFYGMGSPIEIRKNNKKWFYLNHNESKEVEIEESECTVQAKFFFFKSAPFTVKEKEQRIDLEIIMNPMLLLIYVILFIGMILIPVLHLNVVGILALLVFYFVFVFSMLNKAYIIKEKA